MHQHCEKACNSRERERERNSKHYQPCRALYCWFWETVSLGFLPAHLAKIKLILKKGRRNIKRKQEPQRKHFPCYPSLHDQTTWGENFYQERWGGQLGKKEGQNWTFRPLGCCLLLHAAWLIQKRIQVSVLLCWAFSEWNWAAQVKQADGLRTSLTASPHTEN